MRRPMSVRLSDDELAVISEAARRAGLLRGEWARQTLLHAARTSLRTPFPTREEDE